MMRSLLFLLIYIASSAAIALAGASTRLLDHMTGSLTDEERTTLWEVQFEVEKRLPPVMKTRLSEKRPAKGYLLFVENSASHIAASSNRSGELHINRMILTDRALLLKTLLHEWAHLYDFINYHPADVTSKAAWCDTWKNLDQNNPADDCELYFNLKTTISSTPEFREIGGWFKELNGQTGRVQKSSFTLRSPDIYEQNSPGEMFAVNMEYFLTDPEYQCRRPTMFRYLENHFNYSPYPLANCQSYLKIVDPGYSSAEKALVSIDKSRLYQIHYLLASRGSGISSKFGHSMFRLVMCDPNRKTVGPECLKDIQYHIVLSFRAFVDTPEISNLAGLSGNYPSRLFFIPFAQIIEEYNKTELRDLLSYPLALSRKEMHHFIDRSIETHWSYDGKYYFLSNNCATESINLLRSSLLRPNLMLEAAQTPYALRNILDRARLTNEDYFKNPEWAIQNGYLFKSHAAHLEKALRLISKHLNSPETLTISNWLQLTPNERRHLFHSTSLPDRQSQIRVAAAFLLLETYAERRLQTGIQVPEGDSETLQQLLALQSGFVENKGQMATPAQMLKRGYGLPSAQEATSMQSQFEIMANRKSENKSLLEDLYKKIFSKEQLESLSQIKQNKEIFTQSISGR